jgi:NADH dehydrogenase FAD-containing subunit
MGATQTKQPCYEVVVLGAGYAGLMAALRLRRRRQPLRIALVNARTEFVERVRLQEAIVAAVAPRIPAIAALLAGTSIDFIRATVTALDADAHRVHVATEDEERAIAFDHAVYALGSTIAVDAVAGVAQHAYRLEPGSGARSVAALRSRLGEEGGRALRVVVAGGAETGIEAAAEIKTAWPQHRVMLISRSRCGQFKGARVEAAARRALAHLGVELIDREAVIEVGRDGVATARGRSIASDICVWSGGVQAPPLAAAAGLATDPQGRILVDANLRSISHPDIRAVGDAAHPLAPTGAPYRLSAFAALASGAYAADAILAQRAGALLPPFSFSTFGQGIAIGRGGVGFVSYPDDRQRLFLIRGASARQLRNFFVWLVCGVLRMERRFPGLFFWPGRRRVSWQQANEAAAKQEAVGAPRAA